jgi:hypothetical protein
VGLLPAGLLAFSTLLERRTELGRNDRRSQAAAHLGFRGSAAQGRGRAVGSLGLPDCGGESARRARRGGGILAPGGDGREPVARGATGGFSLESGLAAWVFSDGLFFLHAIWAESKFHGGPWTTLATL